MEYMSNGFQRVLGAFLTVSGLVRVWREMRHMQEPYVSAKCPATDLWALVSFHTAIPSI